MEGDNTGLVVLALLILIPLGLLSMLKPKEMWRSLESWKYKNPDAVEPSETEFTLRQLGGAATIVVAIIIVIAVASSGGDEPEPYSGVDIDYLLEQSRQRARTSTAPRYTTPPRVTTTVPTASQANTGPATTGPASSGPASTGPATSGPAGTGPASTGPASSGPATDKIVTGSLTVSNPDTIDQMVDRYLVVTDGEGRVVSRTPLSVEVPARSSIALDPTQYVDLDLLAEGTYYWSIGTSASGSDPLNSGIFAVETAPQ